MAFDSIFCAYDENIIVEIPLRSSTDGSLKTGVLYSGVTIKIHDQSNTVRTVIVTSMTAGTYVDSGWVETSDPGIYQFGLPASIFSGHYEISINISASGALNCVRKIAIIEANLRSASSGVLSVNVERFGDLPLIISGSANNGCTSTSVSTNSFSCSVGASNQFIGKILIFDIATASPELSGLVCLITASTNSATPTFTVSMLDGSPLPHVPSKGDTFLIM